MRKAISLALVLCAVVYQLTGCRALPVGQEGLLGLADDLAGRLGASQITGDGNLIGERLLGEDAYTGRYLAECAGDTGKDVVFGGASLEERKLYVCGCILAESGKAVIRIRMNEDVTELEPDDDGFFETKLSLGSGGNYIMVQYQDFTGTVELTAGYARD